jgi:hypothetical protein
MFKTHGIGYERAAKNKSELYLAMVSAINSRRIELPDSKPLIDELRRLERRRGRSGKDSIDHTRQMAMTILPMVQPGCCWLILNDEQVGAIMQNG